MSGQTTVMAMAVCMALLALWLHVRIPSLGPQSLLGVGLHVAAAFVLFHLAPHAVTMGAAIGAAAKLLAIGGVLYPALVYMFLACIWMILAFQRMMPGSGR